MYPGTTAATHPDRIAARMHGTDQVLTYGLLEERAHRVARVLHDAGMRRGDHLAIVSTNDLRVFEVYWAAMRSGLYVTAINSHLTAEEIAYIVNDCGAQTLVVAGALGALLDDLLPLVPDVRLRLAFDAAPGGRWESYEWVRDAADPTPLADRPRGADMLYSSGTTGRPKGIRPTLPDAQVDEHAEPIIGVAARMWGVGADTVYLSPAPIYHAAPLRIAAAVQALGGTVVVMPRFDAAEALRAIDEHDVTHSQWVPTMLVRMLRLDPETRATYRGTHHRVALHAGAPCPVDLKEQMVRWWGPILTEYYSSTEGNGLTMITAAETAEHPGSVGRPLVGVAHICDDDGRELTAGQTGAVFFERDTEPFVYHGDPERTAATRHPLHPLWTTIGDIGHLDDDGYLYLTDRAAFTIISGGVNVYPQEAENVLVLHPAVEDVAVAGVPDPDLGEAVHAFVVPRGRIGDDALAAELIASVRARIAAYKAPRGVTFVDALPRTSSGKLVKSRLIDLFGPVA